MSSFFHAIVVFGASAALTGCGGRTVSSTGSPDPAGGGGAEPDAGTENGAGGTGSGGRRPSGSGGGFNVGGAIAAGGTSGSSGAFGAGGSISGPDLGPYAQWDCSSSFRSCTSGPQGDPVGDPFSIDGPCPVDSTRPRTPADCPNGQWLACDFGLFHGIEIYVDCACVPPPGADCSAQCDPKFSGLGFVRESSPVCSNGVKLCGCAYTGILR